MAGNNILNNDCSSLKSAGMESINITSLTKVEQPPTYGRNRSFHLLSDSEKISTRVINRNTSSALYNYMSPLSNNIQDSTASHEKLANQKHNFDEYILENKLRLPASISPLELRPNKRLDCWSQSVSKKDGIFFGNEPNADRHLQGQKSLFSDNVSQYINKNSQLLSNLNRYISYSNFSTLSDNMHINTTSPFYKGHTIYGGASAYSKNRSLSKYGIRKPAKLRPFSSIAKPHHLAQHLNSTDAMSNTSKRILDCINKIALPVNDIKRRRISESSDICIQIKNDNSVVADRHNNSIRNLNISNNIDDVSVPSISRLIQMKKLQNYSNNNFSRELLLDKDSTSFLGFEDQSRIDKGNYLRKIRPKINKSKPTKLVTSENSSKHVIKNDIDNFSVINSEIENVFENEKSNDIQSVKQDEISIFTKQQSMSQIHNDEIKKSFNGYWPSFVESKKVADICISPRNKPTNIKIAYNFSLPESKYSMALLIRIKNMRQKCIEYTFCKPLLSDNNLKLQRPAFKGSIRSESKKTLYNKYARNDILNINKIHQDKNQSLKHFGFKGEPGTTCALSDQNNRNLLMDSAFSKIVQSQSAKWECPTCLTRNDQLSSKCLACDQSKPVSHAN